MIVVVGREKVTSIDPLLTQSVKFISY